MTRLVLVLPVAVAACTTVPEAPVQAVSAPSIDALRALPPGVSTNAIGLQNGCYVYLTPEGDAVPLTTEFGQQVCA